LVGYFPIIGLGGDGAAPFEEVLPSLFQDSPLSCVSPEACGSRRSATLPTSDLTPAVSDGGIELGCEPSPYPTFAGGVDAAFFFASASGMRVGSPGNNPSGPIDPSLPFASDESLNNVTFTPRIYASVQDQGWAVLGRFWYLSDSSGELAPNLPPPGSGAGSSAFERLKAYTADLEVSRAICLGTSKVNIFCGCRYASFEAGEGIDISRLTSPSEIAFTSAFTSFSFNGLGVTTGVGGITPIGSGTQIKLIWGVRGSLLWGEAERSVQTKASFIDVSGGTSINSALDQNRDTAFIVEGLLGVQWDHQLVSLPMSAFLRLAAEYQYWDLGDNGQAASASFAVSPTSSAVSKGFVGDVNVQFVGFTVGTGFNW